MFYSPLRYPGGKGKLSSFMEMMIKKTGHEAGTYIEPFAGGAGIALELLEKNVVSEIVINDYDKGIYSFWRAILTETDRFIKEIENIPITLDEWDKQRRICLSGATRYSFELGFATFFMNRTNRSGIIKGGVIGGRKQTGKWKIDARFNKPNLINRIESIAEKRNHIHLYNKDIESFVVNYMPQYAENALVYLDPPYLHKGKQLYLNFFNYDDHMRIEQMVRSDIGTDWIVTYDDSPKIRELYKDYNLFQYDLNYSLSKRKKANELMIFAREEMIPTKDELECMGININLRRGNKNEC